MSEIDSKIMSFGQKEGFQRPSSDILISALEWRRRLAFSGFSNVDAFPGYDGEILISGIQKDFCFEITIDLNGQKNVAFEKGSEVIFADDQISDSQARIRLFEAARTVWIFSVGFTRINSTRDSAGLPASRSKTQERTTPFPLSSPFAQPA